jgi:hypothetical protein
MAHVYYQNVRKCFVRRLSDCYCIVSLSIQYFLLFSLSMGTSASIRPYQFTQTPPCSKTSSLHLRILRITRLFPILTTSFPASSAGRKGAELTRSGTEQVSRRRRSAGEGAVLVGQIGEINVRDAFPCCGAVRWGPGNAWRLHLGAIRLQSESFAVSIGNS